ncbi:MAG: type III polyketide synthase [Planctomycetota bacterium]
MTAYIRSIASAFPDHGVTLDEAIAYAKMLSCHSESQASKVGKLYQRTGVENRGSVLLTHDGQSLNQDFYRQPIDCDDTGPGTQDRLDRFAVEAPRLAIQSSQQALKQAGCEANQITHVVTVTCTGFAAPGFDIALIKGLGLSPETQRVAVGFMGCHALINALRVAEGLVHADPDAMVLISSVELCSLHYQTGYDSQRIVSGAIFADGAASVLVSGASDESEPTTLPQIARTGSCLIPDSEDAMTWRIGNTGFQMTLAASVPGIIEEQLADFLLPWLQRMGLSPSEIGGWAVHPGGVRIVQAVGNALALDESQLAISLSVLRDHGNMSSATLGEVLRRFQEQSVPRPWLMLGFGPGLETEVACLR